MNKLLTFLLFTLSMGYAIAQEKKFSVNTNLLNLAAQGPSLSLEYKLFPKWSIQAYASKGEINALDYYKYATIILDFKFKINESLYLSPYVRYIEKDIYNPGESGVSYFDIFQRDFKGKGISIGQAITYKIILNKTFNLESFVGGGYGTFLKKEGDKPGNNFIDLRIGLLTGINF